MNNKFFKILIPALAIIIVLFMSSTKEKDKSPSIKVYYNNPTTFSEPSYESNSNIGKSLVNLINEAHTSIDFAVYGVRNQEDIVNALIDAKERGVVIRGIVDKDIYNMNYYRDMENLIGKIGAIRTDYLCDITSKNNKKKFVENPYWPKHEGPNNSKNRDNKALISVQARVSEIEFQGDIMHNKFFIIDNKKVWTGSTNISDTGTGGYNANVSCIIDNKKIALWYKSEFKQMYNKGLFHREKIKSEEEAGINTRIDPYTEVSVFFSPQDKAMTNGIMKLIKNAKESIHISVFYLTHKEITAELIKAYKRGVKVQIILDAIGATHDYTKHEELREIGIPVKVENWGGKMHMKAACIDDLYIIMGSMNWTSAGDKANDENTVIIKNKKLAKEYNEFFEILWEGIPEEYLKGSPLPEPVEVFNSLSN